MPSPLPTVAPTAVRSPVLERLIEAVASAPDHPATLDHDRTWTYRQVATVASELADRLARTSRTGPVAVLGEQDALTVAAMLGAVLSGRPLVALDPHLPDERLARVIALAGADDAIVGSEALRHRLGDLAAHALDVTEAAEAPADAQADAQADHDLIERLHAHDLRADDPATIVFTSGSSGDPKGVVLDHATVANGARLSREQMGIGPADRVALVLPSAFAAGQEVVFMSVLNGATLVCHDPRAHGTRSLAGALADVTTLHTTPSLLRALVAAVPEVTTLPAIRLLTTCGEPVHGRDVEAARRVLPRAAFANYLGSSETGHLTFFHLGATEPVPAGIVPAGRPVDGKEVLVLDPDDRPAAPGTTGRIMVVSRHLASGYWRDPDRTAAVFATTPDGRTAYTSGDVGTLEPDGSLRLGGRADRAVKVRGYLVEPAEVESALREIDEITDAVVVPVTEGERAVLVAYACPDPRLRTPSTAALRARLTASLPSWAVPQHLVLLDTLPRNERGKVDSTALPEPPARRLEPAPSTQWEVLLAGIWCRCLEIDEVGRGESFTELGGDSLAVEEMLAAVDVATGVALPSSTLAAAPTLAALAEVVAARTAATRSTRRRGRRRDPAVVLRLAEGPTGATSAPVVCFAGAGGTGLLFSELARRLGTDRPVTAFQTQGLENVAVPDWTVAAAARRYLRHLDTLHRDGPLVLVGHSLGGLFALEVAHRLRAAGRPTPLLVLLDTVLPPSTALASGSRAPTIRIPGGIEQTRAELWKTRFQLLGAGLYPYSVETRNKVFFQHGLRLTDRYHPLPWAGPTEVFLTAENIDDRTWWDQVLTGTWSLHELDTNHVGILKPPYVAQVAETIRAAMLAWEAR